jgi:hypothetical protein
VDREGTKPEAGLRLLEETAVPDLVQGTETAEEIPIVAGQLVEPPGRAHELAKSPALARRLGDEWISGALEDDRPPAEIEPDERAPQRSALGRGVEEEHR